MGAIGSDPANIFLSIIFKNKIWKRNLFWAWIRRVLKT